MSFGSSSRTSPSASTGRPQALTGAGRGTRVAAMRWEERLLDLFDDLEQQGQGPGRAGRDAEVAEQARAEYARVDLDARLHASTGAELRLWVAGLGPLDARLVQVGDGWCLLVDERTEWLVRTAAVGSVRGLSAHGRGQEARPVTARLGLSSALRGVNATRSLVVVHRCVAPPLRGVVERVGADFVEVREGDGEQRAPEVEAVPFTALAAVQRSAR